MQINVTELGKRFGLEEGLMKNLEKSEQARQSFMRTIEFSGLKEGQKKIGNMLYALSTKIPVIIEKYQEKLAKQVGIGGVSNQSQLDYVLDYLVKAEKKGGVNWDSFNKDCGIGLKLTESDIEKIVNEALSNVEQNSTMFEVLGRIKNQVPYVEGKLLKQCLEKAWKAKGLPDKPVGQKVHGKKKAEKVKESKQVKQDAEAVEEQVFNIKDISELIGREMNSTVNTKQNLNWRHQNFGQIILTRFPPEPNGYLHIGHCKAMRFNFMQAKVTKGKCYLRFDDTNPIKQNNQYITNIEQNINWMGYQPWKVTFSSDNFQKLYEFAVQLIKQGNAFVCSETKEEIKKKRGESKPSKDRDRSIVDNLRLFNQMKLGLYAENQLSLRAKIDYKHPNTTLRDPVIYRIRYAPHPHAGDKWCIYPLYDYTHPICDSLEGISHSLCSLEFEIRRELYYWFLDKLNLYRPSVWQYSRLNITNTVLSKRTLHALIFDKKVDGWDDPRVLTINGMRRRGYPAEAINAFCDSIGVTRRGNENYIHFQVLENQVRKHLDDHAPRTMANIDPVILHIDNLQNQQVIDVAYFPKNEQKGSRKIKLTKDIYVDRDDIRIEDSKQFFGIAPNKVIGLKYAHCLFIKQVRHQNGVIKSVHAEIDHKNTKKPKSHLSWLSIEQSQDCTVRIYDVLFTVAKPTEHENFMQFLNKDSKQVHHSKCHRDLVERGLKVMDRVQFERRGFFVVDQDSRVEEGIIVWNQIVSLNSDKGKGKKK